MEINISADAVRELFDYDSTTGVLTRKPCAGTHWRPFPITHSRDPRGYLKTRIGDREYFVHRLVWLYVNGEWPKHEIDHVNRNARDNRIENLRDVPRAVNIANRRGWGKPKPERVKRRSAPGSVEFVKACRTKPYRARMLVDGKRINLGYFGTSEEALAALEAACQQSTGQLTA
jgi:hypothetical protein